MPAEKYSRSEYLVSYLENFVHQMEIQNATRGSSLVSRIPVLLQYMIQKWGELLNSYVEKYHNEVIQMRVFDEKETLANFRRNLWARRLFRSFAKHPPGTYQEAYDRALKHVDIDEQLRIKVDHDEARSTPHHKKEAHKPAPAKRVQNPAPNRSTYRSPSIPLYWERYPVRRMPHRTTPPLREVAWVDGEE
ncbi:hypothetical protein QYF36_016067 [Acer negundo]|nr:hypothetical protein QYF36_016067 [Acer negundo]